MPGKACHSGNRLVSGYPATAQKSRFTGTPLSFTAGVLAGVFVLLLFFCWGVVLLPAAMATIFYKILMFGGLFHLLRCRLAKPQPIPECVHIQNWRYKLTVVLRVAPLAKALETKNGAVTEMHRVYKDATHCVGLA